MSRLPGAKGRQGILPFMLELARCANVTARAGLPLVLETLRALRVEELVRRELPAPKRRRGFSADQKLEALILLLAAGGDRVEDIRILSDDDGLVRLLGGSFPSPDALLDFLGQFDDPSAFDARPEGKKAFVPAENEALRGLDAVIRQVVARGASRETKTATIDMDGTIIEAAKREAKIAYDGTRGYQPLVAVWAEEELVVADEFRDGNVAGGEDPLSVTRRAFSNLPEWIEARYFRGDSACYHGKLLKYLVAEKIGFCIGADMTPELRRKCEAVPEEAWVRIENRAHERVDLAEVEYEPGDWPKTAEPLRYVVMRFTPTQTEMFEAPSPKHLAVASNRRDLTATELVRWYWKKAGTIEHVHRIMKDELGAGVMPSNRFGVNAGWFRVNVLTLDILTILKRRALPKRLENARPKRIRFECLTIPARLVVHENVLSVDLSASQDRVEELVAARGKLLELRKRTPVLRTTRRKRPHRPRSKTPRAANQTEALETIRGR